MKREALRVEQLSVRQENEPLISDVTFTAYQGELLCISGYHHAGKSVLASALVGEQPLDGGRIVMPANQNPRTHICYIGYNLPMLEDYSIAENLFVFCHDKTRARLLIPWRKIRRDTEAVLKLMQLPFSPETRVSSLSLAQKHRLLMLKAMWQGKPVVILNGVGIGYNAEEYEELLRLIRSFPQTTWLYMASRFDPVVAQADRVLCFREKRIGAVLFRSSFTKTDFERAMHGSRPPVCIQPRCLAAEPKRTVLSLSPVSQENGFPIDVRQGEIVGVLDVYGSNWPGLGARLFSPRLYHIRIDGQPVYSLDQALRKGVRMVCSPSQSMLFHGMSLFDNVTMGIARRYSRFGVINRRLLHYAYRQQLASEQELLIAGSTRVNNRLMSLIRCTLSCPRVLILENVLQGLGEGDKQIFYEKIMAVALKGTAVLLITSSETECRTLCHRTLVLTNEHSYSWRQPDRETGR